jgi:hypothetical protein
MGWLNRVRKVFATAASEDMASLERVYAQLLDKHVKSEKQIEQLEEQLNVLADLAVRYERERGQLLGEIAMLMSGAARAVAPGNKN